MRPQNHHPTEIHGDEEFHDPTGPPNQPATKAKRLMLEMLGRWYWIVLGLVLGSIGAAYQLSKAPDQFSATSTLLIKHHTGGVISRDRVDEIDMRSMEGLNTAAERIRRFELLERVASRMDVRSLAGLMPPPVDWRPEWLASLLDGESANPDGGEENPQATSAPPAPPQLAGFIASRMNVSVRRGTRLIDISFTHEVPEVAKALADAVAREFLADLAASASEGRTIQSDALVSQSEQARVRIQEAESALASYRRALEVHESLEAKENEVSQLERRYLPRHPRMIEARSELEQRKNRFIREFETAIRAPSDREYWETVAGEIEAAQEDPDQHLRLARQLLISRTTVLQGEINSQMSVYNAMLTRLQESDINRQAEESSAEISSFARVPGSPSGPNERNIITRGIATGGFAGIALAFLLVRLDNKYHSVSQVEDETGLPVLSAVSNINPRHLEKATKNYYQKHPDQEPSRHHAGWDSHLIFRPGTSSTTFAEMFRVLRASISLLGDESRRKVNLFSSALPGEGKSTISANFALAAAGQGRKTLLIDLDLRKPALHHIFGILDARDYPGVTDWLAGQASFDEAVQRDVGAENLHVLPTGKRAPNPGELLTTQRLRELFAHARDHYDVIVIDSAPLLAVPDTRVIASVVDNFCLVARAHYVPKGAVIRTIELLNSSGTPPAGIVFNGFKESRRMIGYNYSYGSYRLNRYGQAYQYGYGSYGSYGSYGADEEDADEEIKKRRFSRNRKRKAKSSRKTTTSAAG